MLGGIFLEVFPIDWEYNIFEYNIGSSISPANEKKTPH